MLLFGGCICLWDNLNKASAGSIYDVYIANCFFYETIYIVNCHLICHGRKDRRIRMVYSMAGHSSIGQAMHDTRQLRKKKRKPYKKKRKKFNVTRTRTSKHRQQVRPIMGLEKSRASGDLFSSLFFQKKNRSKNRLLVPFHPTVHHSLPNGCMEHIPFIPKRK